MKRPFAPEERADEHYKRTFRQVEVGYQTVYYLEFVAGVDEDPGILSEDRSGRPGQRGIPPVGFGGSENG